MACILETAAATREISSKLDSRASGVTAEEVRAIVSEAPRGLTAEQDARLRETASATREISSRMEGQGRGATAEEVRAIVSAAPRGLTPEQSAKLDGIERARIAVDQLSAKVSAIQPGATAEQVRSAVSGVSAGLSQEQTELLRKAAATADVVRDVVTEQNARIDDLAIGSHAPAPSDASPYLTSREQFEIYSKIINRHDGEFADKQFITLLEQICEMREDFRRLVAGIEQNVGTMKASEVLNSFKTYQVDLDNMLRDAGVRFGAFGTQGQMVDANLQRLVGFVDTDDPAKDGTVAKRLSSGYEYKGKAVYKEKVMVYRTRKTQ